MALDHDTLLRLRASDPAWRLLVARHAPLIASFLDAAFVQPNERTIAEADLVERLEDVLFARRERDGADAWPKRAVDYLADWAKDGNGWLRRFYREGSDEPWYDLTPATEKAIAWLEALGGRSFVGTESRLLTLFELVRQIAAGSETDPEARRQELVRRRAEIDAELERLDAGHLPVLDDTAVRDRFQQFAALARELLGDFREVEENFRRLDRDVRERIARWEGGKGELLVEILGERDAIAGTDQGRSFRAFWDFLMSGSRQEAFAEQLARVLALPAVTALAPDPRLARVHHDWLEAGEHAQRTVAQLSRELRRFLDDRTWLENRRITDIIRRIESHALDLRTTPPSGAFTDIAGVRAAIELPFERPLHVPAARVRLDSDVREAASDEGDADALFEQVVVAREPLVRHARRTLQARGQASLAELVATRPLEHGLAELVVWLQLAENEFASVTDESVIDTIRWYVDDGEDEGDGNTDDRATGFVDGARGTLVREARLPRIVFTSAERAPAERGEHA